MFKPKETPQTSSKSSKKKPTRSARRSLCGARLRILENSKHKVTSEEFYKEKQKIISQFD